MKTLHEIKEGYAKELGFKNWEEMYYEEIYVLKELDIDEIVTRSINQFEGVINRMADLIKQLSESEAISDVQKQEMYLILNEFNEEN